MSQILSRLGQMTDDDLATLRENAERLAQYGTDKQKAEAATVLVSVYEHVQNRAASRQKTVHANKVGRRSPRRSERH